MIFDRLENIQAYVPRIPYAEEIEAFCRKNDLGTLPEGRYELRGSDLFVNVQKAVTVPASGQGWESHAHYDDLQLLITGEETFGVSLAALPEPDISAPERDYFGYKAMPGPISVLTLTPGGFVYFAPGEPHSPCCCTEAPMEIKKAVFKIRTAP